VGKSSSIRCCDTGITHCSYPSRKSTEAGTARKSVGTYPCRTLPSLVVVMLEHQPVHSKSHWKY